MRFTDQEAFQSTSPEAYETLLLDAMVGDATLFMCAEQVEVAGSVVEPILDGWEAVLPEDFPNYLAGTWGSRSCSSVDRSGWKELVDAELPRRFRR